MIQPLFKMLVALSTSLLLLSCNSFIDYNEYTSESNIVYTKADTIYYTDAGPKNPDTIKTIALFDTVFIDAHDSLKFDTLNSSTVDTIVTNTANQLVALGYQVDLFLADTADSALMDSIKNNYDAVVECVVSLEEYSYYTYWGGYYGWYWWYYPGYVTQTTYRTADLFIMMADINSATPPTNRMKMPWMLQINDLVRNEAQAVVDSKAGRLIREGFGQSPYLDIK